MPVTSFKKQLETYFFLIHLFFHALSTGDDKSSLNTILLDIYLHFHVIFWISIVFRLDLSSPVDRTWKNKWIKEKVSLLTVFEGSYWHLKFDISGFSIQILYKFLHFLPCNWMPTIHTCLPHIPDRRQPSGLLGYANLISVVTILKCGKTCLFKWNWHISWIKVSILTP